METSGGLVDGRITPNIRSGLLVLLLGYGAKLVLGVLAPRLGFVLLSPLFPSLDATQVSRVLSSLAFMMSAVMLCGWVVVARARAWRSPLALAAAGLLLLELGIGAGAAIHVDEQSGVQHPGFVLGSAVVRFAVQGISWLALIDLARARSVEVRTSTPWFFGALTVVFVLAMAHALGPWSQLVQAFPSLRPISTIAAIVLMVLPVRLLWKLAARAELQPVYPS